MASYFQSPLGINHVPNFLRARSAAGLRRAMLINNTKQKGFVKYFDIQWISEEKAWFAWFFVTEDLGELVKSLEGKK